MSDARKPRKTWLCDLFLALWQVITPRGHSLRCRPVAYVTNWLSLPYIMSENFSVLLLKNLIISLPLNPLLTTDSTINLIF